MSIIRILSLPLPKSSPFAISLPWLLLEGGLFTNWMLTTPSFTVIFMKSFTCHCRQCNLQHYLKTSLISNVMPKQLHLQDILKSILLNSSLVHGVSKHLPSITLTAYKIRGILQTMFIRDSQMHLHICMENIHLIQSLRLVQV